MKEGRFKQRSNDLQMKKEEKKFNGKQINLSSEEFISRRIHCQKNLQSEELTVGRTYCQKKNRENKN